MRLYKVEDYYYRVIRYYKVKRKININITIKYTNCREKYIANSL